MGDRSTLSLYIDLISFAGCAPSHSRGLVYKKITSRRFRPSRSPSRRAKWSTLRGMFLRLVVTRPSYQRGRKREKAAKYDQMVV